MPDQSIAQPVVPETTPIFDISGAKPVAGTISHDEVQDAVSSGNYSLPKGQRVNVLAPDGTLGNIDAAEAKDAFNNGYTYATPGLIQAHQQQAKYTTPEQQSIGTAEAIGRAISGPIAPFLATALGVKPEDMAARQKYQDHGLLEAGLSGVSGALGVGEWGLLGEAGTGVASMMGLGGEGASIGSRLAASAARIGTEMTGYEMGKQATNYIEQDPNQTWGSALHDIGLSAVLGGALGGLAIGPLEVAGSNVINSKFIKSLADRLAYRGSQDIAPADMLAHEMTEAVNSFHEIGDEVNGVTGLHAEAISKTLPKQMNDKIVDHLTDVMSQADQAIAQMQKEEVPGRLIRKFQREFGQFTDIASNPASSVEDNYKALNEFRQNLQAYSKGRYGPFEVPKTADDYDFVNITKELGRNVRLGLENPSVWGEAGNIQKTINAAWTKALPFVDRMTQGFMGKVGNKFEVAAEKFKSLISQAGRATSETIRQKNLGGFLEGLDGFHDALDTVTEKTGIQTGIQRPALTTLREAAKKSDAGSKFADLLYDKLIPKGAGEALGGGLGWLMGGPSGAFAGTYLGKWVLGPVFESLIKPMMEHGANFPAFKAAAGYLKSVIAGENALVKGAAGVFSGAAKTVPSHFIEQDKLNKLDKRLQELKDNPKPLFSMAGEVGHYLPEQANAIAKNSMVAINYLNGLRPVNSKQSPLDADIPISKAQMAPYYRALSIAEQPLGILQHIKDGTLLPQDVEVMRNLNPVYYNKVSLELTSALAEHLDKGETIPYKLRQSLSLFIGQPLDSTMSLASVQSAQATFQRNQAPSQQMAQGQGKTKHSTSKMGKIAEQTLTKDQSREQRANA